jgi:poly(3-hydroxybutyrate) depolymerase
MRHGFMALTLTLIGALASACANRVADEGGDWQKLIHGGLPRTYLVHLPQGHEDGESLPLVILLHGGGGDARDAARVSGMNAVADQAGFIAVYPNGTGRRPGVRTWNATHCCGYAMLNGIDDVGFLGALIKQLQRDYPVDPRRTYVAGMSNGGMLAHKIAIAYSKRIAAVGAVGAAMFGEEPPPQYPVAAILINGMADRHIPFEGGLSQRAVSRSNMTTEMKPAGYAATAAPSRPGRASRGRSNAVSMTAVRTAPRLPSTCCTTASTPGRAARGGGRAPTNRVVRSTPAKSSGISSRATRNRESRGARQAPYSTPTIIGGAGDCAISGWPVPGGEGDEPARGRVPRAYRVPLAAPVLHAVLLLGGGAVAHRQPAEPTAAI